MLLLWPTLLPMPSPRPLPSPRLLPAVLACGPRLRSSASLSLCPRVARCSTAPLRASPASPSYEASPSQSLTQFWPTCFNIGGAAGDICFCQCAHFRPCHSCGTAADNPCCPSCRPALQTERETRKPPSFPLQSQ